VLAGTIRNHSSDKVAGNSRVAGLTCMVGATGLATARVASLTIAGVDTLTTAGVTMLTTAGVAGLPGHAGA